jgi:hypothetical protein
LDGGLACRKAATYTQNKRTQISTPRVGFDPTTPAKTFRALDRAATVMGLRDVYLVGITIYVCVRQLGMKYAGKK